MAKVPVARRDPKEAATPVVLTKQRRKEPWSIATTEDTQKAPLVRYYYHLRETIEEHHRQTKVFWDTEIFP